MNNIEFKDEFEEDNGICFVCGSETETLIGYNEKEDLCKWECQECHSVYITDNKGNSTFIKGEPRNWEKYLSKNLTFPFNGLVDEYPESGFFEESGPLKYGDIVVINKVEMEDDLYGVIVDIKKGRKKYAFPLCDIDVEDKKSLNYKIVDNYRTWFANCR